MGFCAASKVLTANRTFDEDAASEKRELKNFSEMLGM
jgi:hypothetical protein